MSQRITMETDFRFPIPNIYIYVIILIDLWSHGG